MDKPYCKCYKYCDKSRCNGVIPKGIITICKFKINSYTFNNRKVELI